MLKNQECKVKYVDLEPEYKIKYGSLEVNKKGKMWKMAKMDNKTRTSNSKI